MSPLEADHHCSPSRDACWIGEGDHTPNGLPMKIRDRTRLTLIGFFSQTTEQGMQKYVACFQSKHIAYAFEVQAADLAESDLTGGCRGLQELRYQTGFDERESHGLITIYKAKRAQLAD